MKINLMHMIISTLASLGMMLSVAVAVRKMSITNMFYVVFYFILYAFIIYQSIPEEPPQKQEQTE